MIFVTPRATASHTQLPDAKNWLNSGSLARKSSKLTSTSKSALATSTDTPTMAGTLNSHPSQGSSRWRTRSGSMPRKRRAMMFESHAIHCFHTRCRRRS